MSLGNVKHNIKQIEKLIETHDKMYAELADTNLINSVNIDIEYRDGTIIGYFQVLSPHPG